MADLTRQDMQQLIAAGALTDIRDHSGDFVDPRRVAQADFTREISAALLGRRFAGRFDPREAGGRSAIDKLLEDAGVEMPPSPHPTLEELKVRTLLGALNDHFSSLSNHEKLEVRSRLRAGGNSGERHDD